MYLPTKELPVTEIPKKRTARKRQRLTWKELDACTSTQQIAKLLKENGFKGLRRSTHHCPLARATGWEVFADHAQDKYNSYDSHKLTMAEQLFVAHFDAHVYRWLEL